MPKSYKHRFTVLSTAEIIDQIKYYRMQSGCIKVDILKSEVRIYSNFKFTSCV
jgi:hypothetical protein